MSAFSEINYASLTPAQFWAHFATLKLVVPNVPAQKKIWAQWVQDLMSWVSRSAEKPPEQVEEPEITERALCVMRFLEKTTCSYEALLIELLTILQGTQEQKTRQSQDLSKSAPAYFDAWTQLLYKLLEKKEESSEVLKDQVIKNLKLIHRITLEMPGRLFADFLNTALSYKSEQARQELLGMIYDHLLVNFQETTELHREWVFSLEEYDYPDPREREAFRKYMDADFLRTALNLNLNRKNKKGSIESFFCAEEEALMLTPLCHFEELYQQARVSRLVSDRAILCYKGIYLGARSWHLADCLREWSNSSFGAMLDVTGGSFKEFGRRPLPGEGRPFTQAQVQEELVRLQAERQQLKEYYSDIPTEMRLSGSPELSWKVFSTALTFSCYKPRKRSQKEAEPDAGIARN